MANLSASVHFDWVLAPYDIAQSKAHANVLAGAGLLTKDELKTMQSGLDQLLALKKTKMYILHLNAG
jgi:argininosuccinate lyase